MPSSQSLLTNPSLTNNITKLSCWLLLCLTFAIQPAKANTGLGVGAGLSTSPTMIPSPQGIPARVGESFTLAFQLDIPILETFSLNPSTVLYSLDMDGDGQAETATDISMQWKFIVPLPRFRLGMGVQTGLNHIQQMFGLHAGVVLSGSLQLVSNLDVFLQALYKRHIYRPTDIDQIQCVTGLMIYL